MNNSFNITDFIRDIDSVISQAYVFIERNMQNQYTGETSGSIEYKLQVLHLKVIYALESLEQPTLLKMYTIEVTPLLNNLIATEWNNESDDWYLPFVRIVKKFTNALNVKTQPMQRDRNSGHFHVLKKQIWTSSAMDHDQGNSQVPNKLFCLILNLFYV